MSKLPDGLNLLQAARTSVLEKLIPALPAALRYEALMVANALAIATREWSEDRVECDTERLRLLAQALRHGEHDEDRDIAAVLRELTEHKLRLSNPKVLR